MRPFPRTARRRLAAAVAACALAAGAVTVPLANAEDLKDRQKKVEQRIDHADDALEHSSDRANRANARLEAAQAELDQAQGALDRARSRLSAARLRDQQMQERLAAAVERLSAAEAELAEGRVALEDQQGEVTNVITSIYQEGDPELLAFSSMLDATTTADLTRRMEMQNVMVGRETRAYDDLRAAEVLLEVREQQVQEAKDEVAVQRKEAAEHLVTMKELTAAAQGAKARVRELVIGAREAKWDAFKARRHDRQILQNLKERERRIKERIMRQARKAARQSRGGGYRGQTGGLLNRPVPGYVTSSFGYREHPIYHYWGLHNGTDFSAPCGTPMRAASGGRVIARYYDAVYGNRLFLGLGMINGSYVTAVYNHASSYRYGTGATIPRGAVLGYSGTTGWSTACHLHYTILVNGKPVDPMRFM